MGNNTPGSQGQSLINHPKFKRSDIHLKKNIIETILTVYDSKEFQQWIQSIQEIKDFDQQFLFNPKSYQIISKAMCGNSCVLKIGYENYPYILIDQIKNRAKLKRTFQQNQICASNDFLKKDSSLGDIRPHNIFFNQTGQIKVAHRFSWPGEQSNFQKSKFQNIITFLAPEQIQLLFKGKMYNTNNIRKSESFSIGLSVLCAIFLQDFSYLYNIDKNTFRKQIFTKKMRKLKDLKYYSEEDQVQYYYTEQLLNLVEWLCLIKPQKRISSLQIHKYLLPYEKQIIMFKNFEFKMPSNFNKSNLKFQSQPDQIIQRNTISFTNSKKFLQNDQIIQNQNHNSQAQINQEKKSPKKSSSRQRISVSISQENKKQSPSFQQQEFTLHNQNKNTPEKNNYSNQQFILYHENKNLPERSNHLNQQFILQNQNKNFAGRSTYQNQQSIMQNENRNFAGRINHQNQYSIEKNENRNFAVRGTYQNEYNNLQNENRNFARKINFQNQQYSLQNKSRNNEERSKSPVFTAEKILQIKDKQTSNSKVSPIIKVAGNNNNDEQILQKIQMQLLKSRNMFPS